VDTNVNPDQVDYPVPANEDAVSSIRLMLSYIVKTILEAKNNIVETKEKEEK
jgi:small subunit ribosomal protein S2